MAKRSFSMETDAIRIYDEIIEDTNDGLYNRLFFRNWHSLLLVVGSERDRQYKLDLLNEACSCQHSGSYSCAHIRAVRTVLEAETLSVVPSTNGRIPERAAQRDQEDNNDYFYDQRTQTRRETSGSLPHGRTISSKRDREPRADSSGPGRRKNSRKTLSRKRATGQRGRPRGSTTRDTDRGEESVSKIADTFLRTQFLHPTFAVTQRLGDTSQSRGSAYIRRSKQVWHPHA